MLDISQISLGQGVLGICPMPGRSGLYEADLQTIVRWQPGLVLSMTPLSELERAGAAAFPDDLAQAGIKWLQCPIADFGAPSPAEMPLWDAISQVAHRMLQDKGRILAHCYGGCGRSGMALLRLMCEAGAPVDAALAQLRAVRPCAVETDAQKRWAAQGAKRAPF